MKDCYNNEIDLAKIFIILKEEWKTIISTGILFTLSAFVYCSIIAKPIYEYTTAIRFPYNIHDGQLNSFLETIRLDLKIDHKNYILASAIIPRNTQLIRLTFEGIDPETIKKYGDSYTKRKLDSINKVIIDAQKERYNQDILNAIKFEIDYLSRKINESNFAIDDANRRLKFLLEIIKEKEEYQLYQKAEMSNQLRALSTPVRPRTNRIVIISTVLGVLLGSIYSVIKRII